MAKFLKLLYTKKVHGELLHKHGLELLKDYQGLLHSDKYGVYEKAAKNQKILWIPCWAHVRRKFFEIPETPSF